MFCSHERRSLPGPVRKALSNAHETDAAILDDPDAATLGAIFRIRLLEQYHAVRDALQLQVVVGLRAVVQQHHRAPATREELRERQ